MSKSYKACNLTDEAIAVILMTAGAPPVEGFYNVAIKALIDAGLATRDEVFKKKVSVHSNYEMDVHPLVEDFIEWFWEKRREERDGKYETSD